MGPELVALASAAASTLVTAMATDAWRAVRERLGRLLGRGDQRTEQAALAAMDEDATAVAAGDEATVGELRAQWTGRLRDLLRVDPDAAGLLRELADELAASGASTSAGDRGVAAGRDVNIRGDRGGIAAGSIEGGVHLGNPREPGTGRP